MKFKNFYIIFLISINSHSDDLSIGYIEETYLKSGSNERRLQIYYPVKTDINSETKFIIMNDGEELFFEKDSWNGQSWNIDNSFKDLKKEGRDLNVIVVAIDSAKRYRGNLIDETRRYAEYFPKESIKYINENVKRSIYSNFIDTQKFDYQTFIIKEVIPYIEKKFNLKLNKSNLGIIGASMGGLAALNIAIENPETFGFVGSLSTHWVGIKITEYLTLPFKMNMINDQSTTEAIIYGDEATTGAIKSYVEDNINELLLDKLYFDHGTVGLDSLYKNPQENINKILNDNDVKFKMKIHLDHDHEPKFFGERFKSILEYFLYD